MSGFEIDRHLTEIAEQKLQLEKRKREEKQQKEEEIERFEAEQKRVAIMIGDDLSQRVNLPQLLREIENKISTSRNQPQEYNLYKPRGVSSTSYRIEFGPLNTHTERVQPRFLRKWVIKTNRHGYGRFIVGQIFVTLGFGELSGIGDIGLGLESDNYEEVLKTQKPGKEIHEVESRIIGRKRRVKVLNDINYSDLKFEHDFSASYGFENGIHLLSIVKTKPKNEEISPHELKTSIGFRAAYIINNLKNQ